MTLDEAIKHEKEVVEEQEELYGLCPASESELLYCDGTKDCKVLENGKNKGCLKCAKEHRQLAEWLKELKQLREQTQWILVSERLPNFNDIVLASTDSDYDELRVILTVYSAEEFWFNGKIKAWMPLPKPYKAESEDKE